MAFFFPTSKKNKEINYSHSKPLYRNKLWKSFAKIRANIWFDYSQKYYKIHPIKGIFGGTIQIPIIPEHSKNDHHYE